MDNSIFLTPFIALIIWSLLVWAVLYLRRIPAMQVARIALDRSKSLDGDWKSKLPLKVEETRRIITIT